MIFSVLLWVLVTTLILFCSAQSPHENRYECGPHGKFEYCIDGIPGCVIGCHCYPGYYFDTDTKICEPNIKLTHDFRRHYHGEPTRVYGPPEYTPTVTELIPTPTPTDNLDEKVDEIAKDTDDIGDWLYNQFFKTIENQVIHNKNNTNTKTNKDKPLTRRSGTDIGSVINKSKRKTRKSMRIGKKKKHTKVHGLRRKLLRITEDDSLFDSESDSDSSDSSSYSDSDSSGSESCDTSDGKSKSPDDKDHGHKKVIIFNRRPKPPLPSFIFLPSMDTPYYPPIGLPPPPPMPMYPMVPVPPMGPPMFPFPGPPHCDDHNTTDNQVTTTHPPDASPSEATTDATAESVSENGEATTEPVQGDRRSRLEKHRSRRPPPEKFIARSREPGKSTKPKQSQRYKLMQKLREKMKGLSKISLNVHPVDELKEEESTVMDEIPISQESFTSPHKPQRVIEDQIIPKLEDVDFKYLSELIHRVNQSDTKGRLPSLSFDLNEDLKELQKIQIQQLKHTRRNNDPYNVEPADIETQPETVQHRRLHKQGSEDAYYTNLGRQIASMIRSADSRIEHQSNIDREQAKQVPFHSVLNGNNNPPHSFWERSVRSPLAHTGTLNNNYLDESRTLKHSNEKNLLNLENEVEIFASTPSPLSLQDLENILNTVQKAHAHIKYRDPMKTTQQSNMSLNVNLLPKYERPENPYRRIFNVQPDFVEYIIPPAIKYAEMQPQNVTKITNTTTIHEQSNSVGVPYNDYWMYNPNPRPVPVTQKNTPLVRVQQIHNTNPTRSPFIADARSNNMLAKKPNVEYLKFLRSMPLIKQTTPKRPDPKFLSSPPVVSLNYFTGKRHHYMFEEAMYPLHILPYKRQITKPFGKSRNPSYFHHELHHFDYFD